MVDRNVERNISTRELKKKPGFRDLADIPGSYLGGSAPLDYKMNMGYHHDHSRSTNHSGGKKRKRSRKKSKKRRSRRKK